MASEFKLRSTFKPAGDQPRAIAELLEGVREGRMHQVLLGVTGSGKTFTMANVIEKLGLPTLVISHNKTLAAQLFAEFREFFPENRVEYFVSYYDYYQPEAYIPQKDIYIEKDASINDEIDRLRLAATSALMTRGDVIIVASVSCIYGLGSPQEYSKMMVHVKPGMKRDRDEILRALVAIQYERNDVDFSRGKFRARGDTVEVFAAYEEVAYRVGFFGDEVEEVAEVHPVTGETIRKLDEAFIYPAKHFVLPDGTIEAAIESIESELAERLKELEDAGKILEAQRLKTRTNYDIEMLQELSYCPGIENYSRHLSGRMPGEPPYTLFDYFPEDFLVIVDESHVTLPQIRGMHNGDRSRKETLVEHGFRLPSALDNRPLKFHEFENTAKRVVYISATPNDYEIKNSGGVVVEQIIRPTGLIDPLVTVSPAIGQVEHLVSASKKRAEKNERVLVTTLTKRMAEDLTTYMDGTGIRVRYLHSEIETIERVEILQALRRGEFDVLVGVNLLREGLDLPEVSLVCIMDADKEGFLRSATSLIQTIGRAARNVNAEVILYADKITEAMKTAISETERRRKIQIEHNRVHNIIPRTIQKKILRGVSEELATQKVIAEALRVAPDRLEMAEKIRGMESEMFEAADQLEFERAAELRDRIKELRTRRPLSKKA
jgi:excinuclease ABC subunit B